MVVCHGGSGFVNSFLAHSFLCSVLTCSNRLSRQGPILLLSAFERCLLLISISRQLPRTFLLQEINITLQSPQIEVHGAAAAMNPTAQPLQPSKFHSSSQPHTSQLNAGAGSFAPPIPIRQPALGWAPEQPPLSDSKWSHLHPSEILDSVFLNEHSMSKRSTSWIHLKDPFAGNGFQPSLIPWWTRWCIVFAHKKTNLYDCDIAKIYKHRYRDVIPGIQHMGTTDALELCTFLRDANHEYATEYAFFPGLQLLHCLKTHSATYHFPNSLYE